jgi:hypothetical protein
MTIEVGIEYYLYYLNLKSAIMSSMRIFEAKLNFTIHRLCGISIFKTTKMCHYFLSVHPYQFKRV